MEIDGDRNLVRCVSCWVLRYMRRDIWNDYYFLLVLRSMGTDIWRACCFLLGFQIDRYRYLEILFHAVFRYQRGQIFRKIVFHVLGFQFHEDKHLERILFPAHIAIYGDRYSKSLLFPTGVSNRRGPIFVNVVVSWSIGIDG